LVVGPGSIHRTGHIYTASAEALVIDDLPVYDPAWIAPLRVQGVVKKILEAPERRLRNAIRGGAAGLRKHCVTGYEEALVEAAVERGVPREQALCHVRGETTPRAPRPTSPRPSPTESLLSEADIAALRVLPAFSSSSPLSPPPPRPLAPAWGAAALTRICDELRVTPEGGRNDALNRASFAVARIHAGGHVDADEARVALRAAALEAGLEEDEVERTLESGWNAGLQAEPAHPAADVEAERFTDAGNARRLVSHYRDDLLYVKTRGWYYWCGTHWQHDPDGLQAMARAKETAASLCEEADQLLAQAEAATDDAEKKRLEALGNSLKKWGRASESAARIRAMVDLARPDFAVGAEEMDADLYLLNVPNGTIDLRTSELRPHRREDHIDRIAPVKYDPSATAPRWQRFLSEIFNERGEIIRFVQRLFGYAACGDVREHILPILWGDGANGKGTLLETISYVLGDYAIAAPPNLLLRRKFEGHPTDLARLYRRRMVGASESGEGAALDETLVKWLTGGDTISAREMRQDFFDFAPTHTLFLQTNHRPAISGTDNGIWRRVLLVPFTVTFHPVESGRTPVLDSSLKDTLRSEAPGILRWMVDGHRAWHEQGLAPPPDVRAAVEEYRHAADHATRWAEDCLAFEANATATSEELRELASRWCIREQVPVFGSERIARLLRHRGCDSARVTRDSRSVRGWLGVCVLEGGRP
jgi:putative DNA primase/helicase